MHMHHDHSIPLTERETELTLDGVFAALWEELQKGASHRKHPFHLGGLSTRHGEGVSSRTVVLRKAVLSERSLLCHTDTRSMKVEDISRYPGIAWLFYDPQTQVQLRLTGKATLHFDGVLAEAQWANTKLTSRRCYITQFSPRTPVTLPISGLDESLQHRIPSEEESQAGKPNFVVVETVIDEIDWLFLDSHGHKRALFSFTDNQWTSSWIIP